MNDSPSALALKKPAAIILDGSIPEPETVARDQEKFADRVSSTLASRYEDIAAESAALARSTEGQTKPGDGIELSDEVVGHLTSSLRDELERQMVTFELTVPFGSRVISPPYDKEWATGSALAFGAKIDGKYSVLAADEPSSAAIGIYLTVDRPADVAITPGGTYAFNCLAAQDMPALRSTGGLGLMAYVDSNPEPSLEREAMLWNVNGLSLTTSFSGSGQISDAHSPPVGLGPVYLAPLILRMDPGHRYLIWVWGWQVSSQTQGFFGLLNVDMPFVTVDAGPPIYIG